MLVSGTYNDAGAVTLADATIIDGNLPSNCSGDANACCREDPQP